MELRQLKYFEKTCELLNFTEAAHALCISQSTLSQQIKQLETELGILLFDRIGKRIILTEAGSSFLPYAKNAIRESENGKQIIRDLQNLDTGKLCIGATFSLSPLLTKALPLFAEQYPHIQINITFATSDELMVKLENNEMDFVLSFGSEESCTDFERVFLFSSRLYLVAGKSHAVASKAIINFQDITSLPLILPSKGFVTREIIEHVCKKEKLHLTTEIEINDVNTIISLVKNGKQATILTFAAVRNEEELIKIPIASGNELSTHAYLFWSKGLYRKKAALHFNRILAQIINKG